MVNSTSTFAAWLARERVNVFPTVMGSRLLKFTDLSNELSFTSRKNLFRGIHITRFSNRSWLPLNSRWKNCFFFLSFFTSFFTVSTKRDFLLYFQHWIRLWGQELEINSNFPALRIFWTFKMNLRFGIRIDFSCERKKVARKDMGSFNF